MSALQRRVAALEQAAEERALRAEAERGAAEFGLDAEELLRESRQLKARLWLIYPNGATLRQLCEVLAAEMGLDAAELLETVRQDLLRRSETAQSPTAVAALPRKSRRTRSGAGSGP